MAETHKAPMDNLTFFVFFMVIIAIALSGKGSSKEGAGNTNTAADYSISDDSPLSLEDIQNEVAKKEIQANPSHLKGLLTFEQGNTWSEDPSQEYLVINVSPSAKSKILLTGVEPKSAVTGAGVPIGKGVYRYGFSRSEVEDPIYVNPGDKVYVVSGTSPIGLSFRLNKCSGYLTQSHIFSPPLNTSCPAPNRGNLPAIPIKWREACYDYLEGLPSCYMPINNLPDNVGPECVGYAATEISYSKCVENHQNDKDFYLNEWRVYLNRNEDTWLPRRELIKLLDQNKKTIDYIEI